MTYEINILMIVTELIQQKKENEFKGTYLLITMNKFKVIKLKLFIVPIKMTS